MFLKIFSAASTEAKACQNKTPLEKSSSASTSEISGASTEDISQSHIPTLTTRRHSLSNPFPMNALLDESVINDSFNQSFDPFDSQQVLKRSKSFAYGFKEAPQKCCKPLSSKSVHFEEDIILNNLSFSEIEKPQIDGSSIYSGSSEAETSEEPEQLTAIDTSKNQHEENQAPVRNFDIGNKWESCRNFSGRDVSTDFGKAFSPPSTLNAKNDSSDVLSMTQNGSSPFALACTSDLGSMEPLIGHGEQTTINLFDTLQTSRDFLKVFNFISSLDQSQYNNIEKFRDQRGMLERMTQIIEKLNNGCSVDHEKSLTCSECDMRRLGLSDQLGGEMTQSLLQHVVGILENEKAGHLTANEQIKLLEQNLETQTNSASELKQSLEESKSLLDCERAQVADLKVHSEEVQAAIESQKDLVNELQALASDKTTQIKLEEECLRLKTDNETMKKENLQLQTQLTSAKEEITKLERTLFEKKQVIFLTKSGLDAAIDEKAKLTSSLMAKISILQDFNSIKSADMKELEARCAKLEVNLKEYQNSLRQSEEKNLCLLEEMRVLRESNSSLTAQYEHKTEELSVVQASFEKEKELLLHLDRELSCTNANHEAKVKDLDFQIREQKAQGENLSLKLQKTQQEKEEMCSKLNQLTSILEETDETLKQKLELINNEKTNFELEFQNQKQLIADLESQVTHKSERLRQKDDEFVKSQTLLNGEVLAFKSLNAALQMSNDIVSGNLKRLVKNVFEALSPVLQEKYTSEFTRTYYKLVGINLFTGEEVANLTNMVQLLSVSVSHILDQYKDVQKQLEFETSDKQRYFESLLEKYTTLVIALHKDNNKLPRKKPLNPVK